jgi:hypothetical protein
MNKLIKASPANPTREMIDAADLLLEARLIAAFVHSIGVDSRELQLNEDQTSGFCIVMRDMMNRIQKSEELMGSALDSLNGTAGGK